MGERTSQSWCLLQLIFYSSSKSIACITTLQVLQKRRVVRDQGRSASRGRKDAPTSVSRDACPSRNRAAGIYQFRWLMDGLSALSVVLIDGATTSQEATLAVGKLDGFTNSPVEESLEDFCAMQKQPIKTVV